MSTVECAICAEEKLPVKLCDCNEQDDKRICEECAVKMHGGCTTPTCNCWGFQCGFCRQCDKTARMWTKKSALYWELRCKATADKLELCALEIDRLQELHISPATFESAVVLLPATFDSVMAE